MKTILKNGTVISMLDQSVQYHMDVWIQDGTIENVVRRDPTCREDSLSPAQQSSEKICIIDCTDLFILPGLIDAHVHYDEEYMGDLFLSCGITTVRNMRGFKQHASWRDEILSGKRTGPYIYSTGPIYDGEDPQIWKNTNVIVHTQADVDAGIAFTLEQGFSWMKTYPSIEPELYHYLMKRCRENHLPVCGHMSKKVPAKELADEGYYCCEHSSSLPRTPEEIQYLAKSGMWFCPTQSVCETLPDYVWNGKKFTDLPAYDVLPQSVKAQWQEDNERISASYKKQGIHPDIQVVIDRGRTFLEYSDRYMAGSDCAYPGMIPGYALLDELEKLVKLYGCTPYEALQAATTKPAEHMGIRQKKGAIQQGMDADLVLLKGDPLHDITNIRQTVAVMQGGRFFNETGNCCTAQVV